MRIENYPSAAATFNFQLSIFNYSQAIFHLLLQFTGFLGGTLGKVGTVGGVDDAPRGVDQQATVAREAVAAHFFEASTLGPHTGDKEETVGGDCTHLGEHVGFGGTHDIHHVVGCSPLLRGLQHFLKEFLFPFHGQKLEIECPFVGGEGKKDYPFALIDGKGLNALAYCCEVLPMSPRLASAMVKAGLSRLWR